MTPKSRVQVVSVGGLRWIGPIYGDLPAEPQQAREAFRSSTRDSVPAADEDLLLVGLGFILWAAKLEDAVSTV